MTDQQLVSLLKNRGWRNWGLDTNLLLSKDSQSIVSPSIAARMEGIDPTKDHYEIISKAQD
jgi:hypothetical protein